MAATMALTLEDFAKKLKTVFCAENKKVQKYAEVWLSDNESSISWIFKTDKVIIHVKLLREVSSRSTEIGNIVDFLHKYLSKDELEFMWSIRVYKYDEDVHCGREEMAVYSHTDSCE